MSRKEEKEQIDSASIYYTEGHIEIGREEVTLEEDKVWVWAESLKGHGREAIERDKTWTRKQNPIEILDKSAKHSILDLQ